MKVLFDHNLPHKLRNEIAALCDHEIVTMSFLRWGHLRNGDLLQAAEEAGFHVFVTGDRTLAYEQNLSGRKLAVLALSANNWPIVRNYLPRVLAAIDGAKPGICRQVDCGEFSRKRRAAR